MRSFLKFKPCNHAPSLSLQSKRNEEMKFEKEMTVWRPFRYVGQIASFCAFLLVCVTVCSDNWMAGNSFKMSIWSLCSYNETGFRATENCELKRPLWLTTVIGLLITVLTFATLANGLSFLGLCSSSLLKKLYYFNSSSEINLICGLATTISICLYAVGSYTGFGMPLYHLSFAFGLTCFSALLFLGAAVCMCIDDIVSSVKKLLGYDDDEDEDDVRV